MFTEIWLNCTKVRNVPKYCSAGWLIKIWNHPYQLCSGSNKFGNWSSRRTESLALLTSAQVLTTTTSNCQCGKDCIAKFYQVNMTLDLHLSPPGGLLYNNLHVLLSTRTAETGFSHRSPNLRAPSWRHDGCLWGSAAEAAWWSRKIHLQLLCSGRSRFLIWETLLGGKLTENPLRQHRATIASLKGSYREGDKKVEDSKYHRQDDTRDHSGCNRTWSDVLGKENTETNPIPVFYTDGLWHLRGICSWCYA